MLAPPLFALLLGVAPTAARAVCVGVSPEWPGSSPDYYTVAKEYEHARFVAVVKVRTQTWLTDDGRRVPFNPFDRKAHSWGLDSTFAGTFYDVDVLRAFKGRPADRLRLFSENTSARFWMESGRSYLVFVRLTDTDIGHRWAVDNCGNSAELTQATQALRQLRKLARAESGPAAPAAHRQR